MWTFLLICFIYSVSANEEEFKIVKLDSGLVRGDKFWNGDYYEFYGIPYAKIPTGRNKFKAPEPVEPWDDLLFAKNNHILCHQCYFTEESGEEAVLAGEDECLTINVLVPLSVNETNLAPVVVYIHSGAFSGGSSNMAKFGYLARHDIIVISFNYRVGAFGFACLGNEEIPGNAGLKDQVAALRWIKKNIEKFGGDPNKITLAGFSVGASMAELLALSKSTDGIINQLILESGSALAPFTINRDPVSTAWNIAQAIGYNGSATIEDLTEFYLNAETKDLSLKSVNYFLTNSTFGFAPCIERVQEGVEAVVTESPLDTFKRGDYHKIPVLTGFANMEGISRSIKFGTWREGMNENFADFLPADLKFESEKDKEDVIKEIKQRYFDNKNVTSASLQRYIDYFSDTMFKFNIMKSAKLHAAASLNPIYLYEFSYVGKLNMQHNYMDRIKGASHRDQTAYILDFFGFTNNYKDLDTRERLTTMWSDYVRYGNPTEYESLIMSVNWPPYKAESQNYLEINKRLQVKQGLFDEDYNFWNRIYEKYYWNPTAVKPELNIVFTENNSDVQKPAIKKPISSKPAEIKKGEENDAPKEKNNDDNVKTEEVKQKAPSNLKRTTTIKKIDESGKLVTKVIKHNINAETKNDVQPENPEQKASNPENQINRMKKTTMEKLDESEKVVSKVKKDDGSSAMKNDNSIKTEETNLKNENKQKQVQHEKHNENIDSGKLNNERQKVEEKADKQNKNEKPVNPENNNQNIKDGIQDRPQIKK